MNPFKRLLRWVQAKVNHPSKPKRVWLSPEEMAEATASRIKLDAERHRKRSS
jgi:hypothetical protein